MAAHDTEERQDAHDRRAPTSSPPSFGDTSATTVSRAKRDSCSGGPRGRAVPLRRDAFYDSGWRPALRAAGFPGDRFSFYALRHFCASHLLAEGASITAVAAHLGDTGRDRQPSASTTCATWRLAGLCGDDTPAPARQEHEALTGYGQFATVEIRLALPKSDKKLGSDTWQPWRLAAFVAWRNRAPRSRLCPSLI